MCGSTATYSYSFQHRKRERLKIVGFFLKFSLFNVHGPLPDSLMLVFMPRANVRPGSPLFVTLHRIMAEKVDVNGVVYGSRERVPTSEGVRFEVHLGGEKVLKGTLRKDEGEEWKMECKCELEREVAGVQLSEAEVCLVAEGHVAMTQRLEMAVRRTLRGRGFQRLEEIPEEREAEKESEDCCSSCGEAAEEGGLGGGVHVENGGEERKKMEMEMEMEMERVRWAVDVGIWVMCLGVGYLVSKASSKGLRRRKLL